MTTSVEDKKQNPGQLNSVQLNIVTFVDMEKAAANGSLKDAVYMMDNSVGGQGQGTPTWRRTASRARC